MTLISRIVLVSGSHHDDIPEGRVHRRLNIALKGITRDELLVLHGDARGVDLIAHFWCVKHGVRVITIPALFEARGRDDGRERNRFLVTTTLAMANHFKIINEVSLEAFPGPKSRGTFHCISHAKEFGIPVTVTTG